ncbi:SMI1/KNR4 family protein [Mesorhizobium sp. 1M-11]|uniref:SMI1/KNR4 family protein n=1 Tax=Mesorhizobium sp. 1M-11 TaxID=1529006 RepID=UPI000AA0E811|nr:SMI1/KNR4 family protein [Mesorhizobium sp. 1M-11]
MPNKPNIRELIEKIVEAQRKYDSLKYDEELPHELGKPATDDEISSLEKRLGIPLPESYREFLTLHNGWSDFDAGGKLLATHDHNSKWVKEKIEFWGDLWPAEEDNPFENGALPVMFGEDLSHFLVLDPSRVKKNGKIDFVEYEDMYESDVYKDFADYLGFKLETLEYMIDEELNGVSNDADNDED